MPTDAGVASRRGNEPHFAKRPRHGLLVHQTRRRERVARVVATNIVVAIDIIRDVIRGDARAARKTIAQLLARGETETSGARTVTSAH